MCLSLCKKRPKLSMQEQIELFNSLNPRLFSGSSAGCSTVGKEDRGKPR